MGNIYDKETKNMYDRREAEAYVIGTARDMRRRRDVRSRDGVETTHSAGGRVRDWRVRGYTCIRTGIFGLRIRVRIYSRE